MITSIRLKNFKNFADETLRVGPFTLLVGANASGKSNIRDAFRFLAGIGRGYTLTEIFGGKREAGWKPIRGAMNEIIRFGQLTFSVEVSGSADKEWHYSIEVERDEKTGAFNVRKEELRVGSVTIYTASREGSSLAIKARGEWSKRDRYERTRSSPYSNKPALTDYIEHVGRNREGIGKDGNIRREQLPGYDDTRDFRSVLADMRFLDLLPERLREPSFPGATVLGDNGENLPTVLEKICSIPERQKILVSWIDELTPMDVKGFEFPRDPSGRVHLTLCEANGRKVSAYSASDGTLRFLGILAALLSDTPTEMATTGLYFLEEIDTGIHPARQWLLLELIEKQAAKRSIQVVTTTHSPDLLTFVNDSTFEHLSVVCRLEDSQDAIIRPVAELPNAEKLRTSKGGLGRLLAEGWMETALAFTEDRDEAEDERRIYDGEQRAEHNSIGEGCPT